MPKRKTVSFINSDEIQRLIGKNGWSNAYFCTTIMTKPRGWISEWGRKDQNGNPAPKNLPSPEEAARMCAILQVTPEEILTEQADIELVRGLIDSQKERADPQKGIGFKPSEEDWERAIENMSKEEMRTVMDMLMKKYIEE